MNQTIKFQNHLHFKIPITINPLDYGKIIEKIDNKYIIQLNTTNVVVINQIDNNNFIKFFKKGELMFEYKDSKISERSFIRTIQDQKYTFENNRLISTEIMNVSQNFLIYKSTEIYNDTDSILTNPLYNLLINYKLALLFILFGLFFISLDEIIPGDFVVITSSAAFSKQNIIKLRKRQGRNIWNVFSFKFSRKVFTTSLFIKKFNKFWIDIESKFNGNNHLFILFKIRYVNNDFVGIGKLQRLNPKDKQWYIDFIIENMKFKSEYYNETQIDEIVFSYGFKKGIILEKDNINPNIKSIVINNMNLPISSDPLDFGRILNISNIENGKLFIIQNKNGETIMISKFETYNDVEYLKDGISLIKFKDEITSFNKFIRIIDNKNYYFENGEQFLFCKKMKTKFISKTSKSKILKNNFITLDIETYIKDNILTPFCISFYDGKNITNFYLTNYKNVDDLIITALKSIMVRKYNGYNVYMHNMAKFDVIFLFKYLIKLGLVHPIIHNDRIISIEFNYGPDNEYQIKFRDSLLLLLRSLDTLCKSFKVDNAKTVFPIFFVDENNLDYIGKVPNIKYFKNIKLNHYITYKSEFKNNWNLKNEAINYCNLDCISLYQILFKFNDMIFSLFGKNIHHYPTLPSLAFAIFRSNFMDEENIPQLSGKIADDIRQGYTGGAVDMYIPKSKPGVKIKGFDVNSLYPSQMEDRLMPIGNPTYFEGDILKLDPNAFGFCYCKIIAPDNIKHPILQTHVKTNNGTRTISPVGTWYEMMFSEELNNAKKYGYQFEILWGYTFNSNIIFKEYVNFLFNLRSQYPSSDPMNFIAKILMNSLYGRFGMEDNFANIDIIHKDYYVDFENKYFDNIIKTTEIDDYVLVEFTKIEGDNENNTHNISIAIAASITAYSRIHMTQFKNNPKIILYYTDTDSIYVDENSVLDIDLIDNKLLGKLKLENTCNKAIFLSPKVYCLDTENNGLVYKVKGLKHEIELTMNDFEQLLRKNSLLKKSQFKLRKFLNKSHIEILEQVYTLQVTDNKRKLIYDKNNLLIATEAYKISESKDIRNK